MVDNTLISIIIPIYNSEKYLKRCISSILLQTHANIEVVLVNDGSTDDSKKICERFASQDDRIMLINTENKGVSSARNTGLDLAKGRFIGFVDSDDYIDAGMYETLLRAIVENEADIAECGYYVEGPDESVLIEKRFDHSVVSGSFNCSKDYVKQINTANYNWNKLYKREVLEDVRYSDLAYSEDYILNVKAFYNCEKKVTVVGCYYHYLINEEGAVNKPFSVKKFDMIYAGEEMIEFHQSRYKELIPDIAMYTMKKILAIHGELKRTKVEDKITHIKKLRSEASNMYGLLSPKNKKMRFRIYMLCPDLFFFIEKVLKS